jgi:transposase
LKGGLSRHRAAAQFSVAVSTVVNWVRRYQDTGSVAPGQMGGRKPKAICGNHHAFLVRRVREGGFTLRGLVRELAEHGLKVDYRSVWNFVHAERLSFKKKPSSLANATASTWRGDASSGQTVRTRLIPIVSSSSMKPGRKPIWSRFGDGRRAGKG